MAWCPRQPTGVNAPEERLLDSTCSDSDCRGLVVLRRLVVLCLPQHLNRLAKLNRSDRKVAVPDEQSGEQAVISVSSSLRLVVHAPGLNGVGGEIVRSRERNTCRSRLQKIGHSPVSPFNRQGMWQGTHEGSKLRLTRATRKQYQRTFRFGHRRACHAIRPRNTANDGQPCV